MFLIVGYIIILGSALGTYAVHGSLAALWMPLEYVAIVGLALGSFLASNDIKVIKSTIGALPSIFKGSKFNKAAYVDLLAMLFEVLAKVRKEGLMSIENDVENPHESPIFGKYPGISHDHHVMEFITESECHRNRKPDGHRNRDAPSRNGSAGSCHGEDGRWFAGFRYRGCGHGRG